MFRLGRLKANPYLYGIYQPYARWRARQAGPYGKVPPVPLRIGIETTNICNLKCEFCGYRFAKRKKGFISLDLYREVISQLKDIGVPRITLHTVGEPLLHKNIVELVRIAKTNGILVGFSTNGQALTKELASELIKAGLDGISFSGDGGTKQTYERLRKGGSFERLVENIHTIKKLRDEIGEITEDWYYGRMKRPKIGITCVYTDLIKYEIPKYIEVFAPLVDFFKFVPVENQGGQISDFAMFFPHWKGIHVPRWRFMRRPCDLFWSTLFVTWNGEVTPCCIDFDGKRIVGDINKEPLEKIWQADNMNYLRNRHIMNRMEETADCAKCDRLIRNPHKNWFFSEELKRRYGLKR